MKETIKAILFVILVGVGCSWVNNHYTKDCIVVDVTDEVVTIQTEEGNYFEFYGDNYNQGEVLTVTFSDNDTVGVKDDKVIQCMKKVM